MRKKNKKRKQKEEREFPNATMWFKLIRLHKCINRENTKMAEKISVVSCKFNLHLKGTF